MNDPKIEAQIQVDAALAEVARLQTVAAELDKTNDNKVKEAEAQTLALQTKILQLQDDEKIQATKNADIRSRVASGQVELNEITHRSDEVAKELSEFFQKIRVKTLELDALEEKITKQRATQAKEMDEHTMAVNKAKSDKAATEAAHAEVMQTNQTELNKIKSKLNDTLTELETAEQALVIAKREESASRNEMQKNQRDSAIARDEVIAFSAEIADLETEKKSILVELGPLRKEKQLEVDTIQELKKERMQLSETNRSIVENLDKREVELKQKYEAVGLVYPS